MPAIVDRLVSRISQSREDTITARVGDAFPLDKLVDRTGGPPQPLRPGERAVLWFYPRDNTAGCTLEGRQFTRLQDRFDAANVRVWGVSGDTAESHANFSETCGITVSLLSDPDGRVGRVLGNWAGTRHRRSTFIINDQHRIVKIYPLVAPLGHPEEILADLGAPA